MDYIAARGDVSNALHVFDRLVARVDTLAETPERGRKVPEFRLATEPPLQEVIERPWRIMYACERGCVVVAAVVDGRRKVAVALRERFGVDYPDFS